MADTELFGVIDARPSPALGYRCLLLLRDLLVQHCLRLNHGLVNYIPYTRNQNIYLKEDFAAGVYQHLQSVDTVSHVGLFYPAL
jgi:hypothetical protein